MHLRLHFLDFLLVPLGKDVVFYSELVLCGLFDLEKFTDLILSILELQLQLGNSLPGQSWVIQAIRYVQLRIHNWAQRDCLASLCELQGAETFLKISMVWS